MKPFTQQHLDDTVQQVAGRDPALLEELKRELKVTDDPTIVEEQRETLGLPKAIPLVKDEKPTRYGKRLLETIVRAEAHPVLLIRDNKLSFELLSARRRRSSGQVWLGRLRDLEQTINTAIPAVGRVEVDNHPDYTWVGTGWLIDNDVIVTNRHVAREFARRRQDGFGFRLGIDGVAMSGGVDFLEEYERSSELTFAIESVLWIAEPSETDVAFLRLRRDDRRSLPPPITLADGAPQEDALVATIGYPARDNRIPDQRLVRALFGDVYEKKRLAPGQIMRVTADEIEHDCSTLGGNSGSLVLDLATGHAVGLHFAGQYMTANYAVSSTRLASLLDDLKHERLIKNPTYSVPADPPPTTTPTTTGVTMSDHTARFRLLVPLDITVAIGQPTAPATPTTTPTSGPTATDSDPTAPEHLRKALDAARAALKDHPDITGVRLGYRFRNGWITDERAIVVSVREKKPIPALGAAAIIPNHFLGIGVDVRGPDLRALLAGLDIATESVFAEGLEVKPGLYAEPPHLELAPVKEKMKARFHVSPDAGFPELKAFLGRVKKQLHATMYEWDPNHVSDAIAAAIKPGDRFKLVSQYRGTHEAVDDMRARIPGRLDHAWASVGKGKLIPLAYHIKVASRDDAELWLSSGNWKQSNQPDISPAADNEKKIAPLRTYNRDWHVVLENEALASLFRAYIDWDFDEARRVPIDEAVVEEPPDLFVPDGPADELPGVRYHDPLAVDEELEIQPLLTPDRDDHDHRMFLAAATALVQSATQHVWVQNQSFSLLGGDDNEDAFVAFMTALREKQDAGLDVKILFRDPREFHYANGTTTLANQLERIKDFGFDTKNNIRVQWRLHTKAIMVDSKQVLFGSHNLTNTGALYNRDASLLVRNAKVAAWFEKIFLYDWERLATQNLPELPSTVHVAKKRTERPPAGFHRVTLAELAAAL